MYILPGALAPLASYRQFIVVQLLPALDKAGNVVHGKSVKHPVHPGTLLRHSAHDPAIWLDWESAARIAASSAIPPGALGWCIGFVITERDPIGCLDIDNCATLQGTWNEDAIELMRRLPGVVEVSLSGRGLHVWFMYGGVCPPHGKRNTAKNIELYSELRFIALGGDAQGTMYDLTAHLPQFIADYFPPGQEVDEVEGWTTEPVPEYSHLDDAELIRRAMVSERREDAAHVFGGVARRANFADLWTRDVAVLSQCFPPQMANKEIDGSAADMALAKELAYWTGKNCERIARLMNQSALKRDKWDVSVHRDYFRDTVMRGVGFCSAVYQVKSILPAALQLVTGTKLAPKVIDHETFIGRENLAVIFAGCVYIQDTNSVLLPNGDIVDQARFNAKFAGYTFCMDNLGEKTTKSAWEAFIGNQLITFPRAQGTVFDPRIDFQDVIERAGRTWLNVYKAPVIDRRPGDVAPFMTLLHKLLPHGDDALILLSYMAACAQNPGVKFRWAPFIQGTQGNGKSTLVQCLRHALGNKYIFSVKTGMIENGFNAWLENNVLYVADDIYSAKDRTDMMEALKSLITETTHAITLKGIDSIQKIICGNFIFTDNHKDAMKKQDDSRRICSLYCAQQNKRDRIRDGLTKEFFMGYYAWLEGGGFAHIAEMLLTMPIDPRYNPAGECQEAPDTSVTKEAIVDGRTGVEHEVAEWIELGEPGFCGDFISMHVLRAKLKESPQFSKSASPLNIKNILNRFGYEPHPALPEGRTPTWVMHPDNTRPVLYVKHGSWVAELTDPAQITALYTNAQSAAITEQTMRRFNQGAV